MVKYERVPSSVVSSTNWTNPSNALVYDNTYGTLSSTNYNNGNNRLVIGNFIGDSIPSDRIIKGFAVEVWSGYTSESNYPIFPPIPGQKRAWMEIWPSLDGINAYGSEPLMVDGRYNNNQPNNPQTEVAGASTFQFPDLTLSRDQVMSASFALIILFNQGRTWDRDYRGVDPQFDALSPRIHTKDTFSDSVAMNGIKLHVYTEYDLAFYDSNCDGEVTIEWPV